MEDGGYDGYSDPWYEDTDIVRSATEDMGRKADKDARQEVYAMVGMARAKISRRTVCRTARLRPAAADRTFEEEEDSNE